MNSSGKVLILGASGGIGGEVARRLAADNWQVRALKRGAQVRDPGKGMQWIAGDALDAGQVAAAAAGCDVIVHAVNPPGYRHWRQQVLPMLRNTLQAAEQQRALVVLPGTVYNYGPDAFPLIAEEAAQQPVTRKGAIRVEMEQALEDYVQRGGRALIVRAGDFFGPRAGNSWFSQGLIRPGQLPGVIRRPGAIGVGHQWAWLPDVAATIAALLARRHELEPFSRFHMQGHWDPDGSEMSQAIQRVVARYGGRAVVKSFPWWLVKLAAPFNATLREMVEMHYLWRLPVRLRNDKLVAFLGAEPHTPLDRAVHMTLQGLGCLPAGAINNEAREA
ncbi:NAD dependent epimerase/dehydratase [Klebsiella quasipneumoniae subsp. quasipneumoniae]|uniref:NAD-dependent epimerase/dehydratase family protein n=1 Tax=Klebsiella quasipneumoniae TaxID=1463165 RepID=UPI0006514BD1|nr:NAD-dependent epimerase/dehydratase family protein [Klebsiella quasipneumoniae]KMH14378.1 NAD dependent epimerase/dehydratase [Klebsiella quasipneumoniae subsp. quasipneumoniae]VGE01633.1 3-beta hydroxysteroid dehydrogenase/isomerase family protein [Klebsiella quasipneumoniae]GKO57445.1 membrane protein [Klebsiella quasipneumoniae]HBR2028822.1 NAD(P)H-binding protein [Klebsiella quasipneumoniae subsp. quasipneumoniae]HCI8805775.1 NAD(P)H-binding protein [Klebsiella quasipneumoniae]